jgi:rSAM/selenodomain-associated transferase 2/rSAM/selenodomain-associated transferase 1
MASRHLLIFSRWPEPGHTKTRLIPAVGAEGAADLQEWLTGHTLLQSRLWAKTTNHTLHVLTTGASLRHFRNWLGPDVTFLPQAQGDLGDRLSAASGQSFDEGADQVVMIGIDCPGITAPLITDAFDALDRHQAVIGPATDGGYTLLGLTRPEPGLFQDMPWGTTDVLDTTLQRFQELGLSFHTLPALADIDEEPDLAELENFNRAEHTPGLSIIIPALNEEASIARAVKSARSQADEVIVVDGGSRDATVQAATDAGATVITSPPGRGRQMNTGAFQATFDTLLFLHADSELPPDSAADIRHALQHADTSLTAFHLGIRGHRRAYRWIESAVTFRSKVLQRPYGDQALALRRSTFIRLGGYAHLPLLEDLNLVRRAARRGRIHLLPHCIQVSDRRWRTKGVLRTTLLNQAILFGHALGISPMRLKQWYGS